jgi:uncharacterized ubiquitin-like protein YukD
MVLVSRVLLLSNNWKRSVHWTTKNIINSVSEKQRVECSDREKTGTNSNVMYI